MNVTVNKQPETLNTGITVSGLLELRKVKKAAVWINGQQLLAAEYEARRLEEGDEIRILRIIAGG